MSYVQPTLTNFRTRYPEFASVDDTLVQTVLDESIAEVGDTWLDQDRAKAQMLLTAHKLVAEGYLAASSGSDSSSSGSVVKMEKAGDHQIEYAVSDDSIANAQDGGLETSVYGNRYLKLLRNNFPAVFVAGAC